MRTRLHADDAPFTFVTALQSHFAVHNLDTNGANVKTLGLGGKMLLDYAEDPMHPQLHTEPEDYVRFGGAPLRVHLGTRVL